MEKKTMDTLRTMICGELDDIAKKGSLTHEQLDVLKDLLESAKNLEKIEKYQKEKEGEYMDMGYSQRKFYIDADYNPMGPNSYARGPMNYGMDGGNSYGRSRMMYDMGGNSYMDGNSYMYYDPRYDQGWSMARGGRGYSMTGGSKTDMVGELTQMMNETSDAAVKNAIAEAIQKMNK